ncbi:glycosyltransferase family 117 protein [Chryseobacterium sp. T1]
MKNWTFKKWNTILGWVVFAIAFFTYISTIEHTLSFWDCGEYISSAVKLEVTHAPGAALFQLVGAVSAVFALGNASNYALVINAMSATFSAFTILFLFWTITHLVRRLLNKDFEEVSNQEGIGILFSGVVGALCFTFSDSFWFSAVEGEVYAMASLFIALILWCITKWENEYKKEGSERWIILLFFITGLSVGVHMMCMLAVPAACLIYYTRNYSFTWKSFVVANVVTLVILGVVFKGIFPLIMTLFGKSEIFFVNGLGLPFHSGTIFAFVLLILACYFIVNFARKSKKNVFQTIALSIIYMIIGFSCWMVIPIRANANPPMNLNDPDNAIGMLDYYNRVQYGDWPTLYGQNYTAYLDANGIQKNEDGSFKTIKTGDVYEKDEKTGRYRVVGDRFNYVFNPAHVSFLPRMFSEDKSIIPNYISMYGAPDFSFNYDNEDAANSQEAKQYFDDLRKKFENGSIRMDDYNKAKQFNLINVQRPSLAQNLDYFITFQNYYYFVRYLLWNFSGRQNDLEGNMQNTNGNFITGISAIDDNLWGNQSDMPENYRNESTVYFFMLPLILGILGFFFQLNRDFGRFYAILSLFIITSVGIVFYTGMKPFEVRERDYAMVGSFYAFAIWIGLGVAGIYYYVQKKVKSSSAQIGVGVLLLGVPLMMGFQNYNVHDRSDRTAAYDYSYSALKSLPKNDIMFVYGDNDTYPVWGLQETEEFRSDVKVVNFTLLATPWYLDQVKRKTYNAMPVPSGLTHDNYRDGTNDQIFIMSKKDWQTIFANLEQAGAPETEFAEFRKYLVQDSMSLKDAINFLKMSSENKTEILKMVFGENSKTERFNFLPVSKFTIPVDVNSAVKSGIITAEEAPLAEKELVIDYKSNSLFKNNLMLLDILAHFDWKRPINFSTGGIYENENIAYLGDYLQYDGFSYRLVPIKTPQKESGEMGRVNANNLYNIVKNYKWGNFKNLKNHYDETAMQNIVTYRSSVSRAVDALVATNQKSKAVELLSLVDTEIPVSRYNDPRSLSSIVFGYIVAGQEAKGLQLAEDLKKGIFKDYDYFINLPERFQMNSSRQIRMKPLEYSLIVGAVADAYIKIGETKKAQEYTEKSINTIDKRFDAFIKDMQQMGKEKAFNQIDKSQNITNFYQYLFDVMNKFDTTYATEKEDQVTRALMKVAQ